jgi:hypothetical protein
METIEKGMVRLIEALNKLKTPSKVKFVSLNNVNTRVKKIAPAEVVTSLDKRDALAAEAEAYLKYDHYYEWNANINGVIVQLRTNVGHLNDFWVDNWYPAQLEADIEPHGIIYAIDGVAGREPHSFYNSETKTGVLFNTDSYGALRNLALGLVSDVGERSFDLHSVRGLSADFEGLGFVLIGPKGTKKTEIFYNLIQKDGVSLHSNDILFVRYGGGYAAADMPERKLLTPTESSEVFPRLAELFEKSKCENVVTRAEECTNHKCKLQDKCGLEKGNPYCFWGTSQSYALLDPYWIGGMKKHVKRIDIRTVFILKSDPIASPVQQIEVTEAVQILENGSASGPLEGPSPKNQPFFNPHLLLHTPDRIELQKKMFTRLFRIAKVFTLNTGIGSIEEIQERILNTVKKSV